MVASYGALKRLLQGLQLRRLLQAAGAVLCLSRSLENELAGSSSRLPSESERTSLVLCWFEHPSLRVLPIACAMPVLRNERGGLDLLVRIGEKTFWSQKE